MPDLPAARPRPSLTEPDTGAFWQAAREHRLTYQTCLQCRSPVFFRRRHCPQCGSQELEEGESAGLGELYSYTVIRRHSDPFFRSITPYIVGVVDLDEGFRMLTHIRTTEAEVVRVGQRVVLEWEENDGWALPVFRPDPAA